jgi:hypothetical protein
MDYQPFCEEYTVLQYSIFLRGVKSNAKERGMIKWIVIKDICNESI